MQVPYSSAALRYRTLVTLVRSVSSLFFPGVGGCLMQEKSLTFYLLHILFPILNDEKTKTPPSFPTLPFHSYLFIHSCGKKHVSQICFQACLTRRAGSFQFGRSGLIESVCNGVFVILFSVFVMSECEGRQLFFVWLVRVCVYIVDVQVLPTLL